MGRNLESLFARYVERGDLRALTRVFDRTARDLLGLAQHLVRNPDDAEDLVQSTFVTAIDRASAWDRDRALLPWLSGILARQASNLIRARARRSVERLGEVEDRATGPVRSAEAVEMQSELGLALGRVGTKYREVLEPYLRDGERPETIARSLGRAPGTVRTQIHRGLTQLRRFLPAGVSAGFLVGSVRGLPAVRAAVLRHATASALPVASAGAVGAGLVLGGTIMVKKILVIGVGTLAASIGVFSWSSRPFEPVALSATETASEPQLASLPVELVASSAEPALTGDHAPGVVAAAPDRKAIRRGRALVRGSLEGIDPEHVSDVELSIRKARRVWGINSSLTDNYQLSRYYGDALRVVESERIDFALEQTAYMRYGDVVRKSGTDAASSELVVPGGVHIAADGRFEIDLTEALLAAFAEDQPGEASYSITASHLVYLDETGGVSFSGNDHTRVLAGEEIVLDLDLELEPAAVIRGTVSLTQGEGEESPELAVAGRVRVLPQAPAPTADSLAAEYRATAITFQAQWAVMADVEGSGQLLLSVRNYSPGIELALFRAGSNEPLAKTRAKQDGSFEFRVAEDGPFVIVAVASERPPFLRAVDASLKTVLEIAELEVPEGSLLEGLVEDFGAFPGGGIALEAERIPRRGDVPIEWLNHLAWSGGSVVRTHAATETESGGLFTMKGLSPAAHKVRLAATGSATLFSEEELDAAAEEVVAPARDLQLVLPLTVLEIRAERPPFMDEDVDLQFVVEDSELRTELARAWLDGDGLGEVVARPGQELRIRIEGEGLVFPDWVGVAPEAGERVDVRMRGREAPATASSEDGD